VIDANLIKEAFDKAVETAYKAVMKPKEGTILTVAKGCAQKATELEAQGVTDLGEFFAKINEHAKVVLSKTPDMLPVLKQAGVVDSGGQGLVEILDGALLAYQGKAINLHFEKPIGAPSASKGREAFLSAQSEEAIKFGSCTEFLIMLRMDPANPKVFNMKNEIDFKAFLESLGDSIVCVADDDVVKVHVHTNDPGLVLQRALRYGPLSSIKIDNMRLEHQEILFKEAKETQKSAPSKAIGFVAVSAGDGLNEIFKSLGVDILIEGGQTMNPSTGDILDAVEKVDAQTVFVLPNNKNIIFAANQAAELSTEKEVLVIPTKTIPQGINAVIHFVPELSVESNEVAMMQEIGQVKTGQVTYAVRDTIIEDKEIKQGDYMGIGDEGILSVGINLNDVTLSMLASMMDEDAELISIYYGSDVTEETAQALLQSVQEAHPTQDIELQSGGQPIYYYVVSVE
ncbi:MAG: DAK2 domain-containing protein, partial [Clostridium sp.]|nr:DAK2 domain-containing protein [Clostridium sp.]